MLRSSTITTPGGGSSASAMPCSFRAFQRQSPEPRLRANSVEVPSPSATIFLDHFGLSRPYRFERTILAGLAILLALLALLAAVWMRATDELQLLGPRGQYFLYLLVLLALALTLVRWPRLGGLVLALLALELAWGAGLFALKRAGLASTSLIPPGMFEPQRFEWTTQQQDGQIT